MTPVDIGDEIAIVGSIADVETIAVGSSVRQMERKHDQSRFVVCLRNGGYEASLEPRKIYEVIPDTDAEAHAMIRIVDESGEDYLYPASLFAPIALPQSLVDSLAWAG